MKGSEERLPLLAPTTWPSSAGSTRHRLLQYVAGLASEGIGLAVRPFLDVRTFAGLHDEGLAQGLRRIDAAPRRSRAGQPRKQSSPSRP